MREADQDEATLTSSSDTKSGLRRSNESTASAASYCTICSLRSVYDIRHNNAVHARKTCLSYAHILVFRLPPVIQVPHRCVRRAFRTSDWMRSSGATLSVGCRAMYFRTCCTGAQGTLRYLTTLPHRAHERPLGRDFLGVWQPHIRSAWGDEKYRVHGIALRADSMCSTRSHMSILSLNLCLDTTSTPSRSHPPSPSASQSACAPTLSVCMSNMDSLTSLAQPIAAYLRYTFVQRPACLPCCDVVTSPFLNPTFPSAPAAISPTRRCFAHKCPSPCFRTVIMPPL